MTKNKSILGLEFEETEIEATKKFLEPENLKKEIKTCEDHKNELEEKLINLKDELEIKKVNNDLKIVRSKIKALKKLLKNSKNNINFIMNLNRSD